mgnify:CR=1 FL=1
MNSTKKLLKDSLREDRPTIVVGSCTVDYKGRAGSILPEGERIVMTKPDGTLLVHQKEKREPVNWNPPGCTASVSIGEDGLRLLSKRSNPEETLLVVFEDVKMAASFELIDDEELRLVGTEEDLVDSVMENPSLIEEGFKVKQREKPVRSGVIDIYGVDSEGRGVVVEFKRGKAALSAVGQLGRYVKELEEKIDKKIRGIIVSPAITSGAKSLLSRKGLEYVKLETSTRAPDEMVFDRGQKRIKEFTDGAE